MTKNELRIYFKKQRQDFVFYNKRYEIDQLENRLGDRLLAADIMTGTIGGYAAMTSEFDPAQLLSRLRSGGHQIALPYFENRHSEMEFRLASEALERGPFSIDQPQSNNPAVKPETILVPLVAADAKGNRLGQGQGHFDRFLSETRKNGSITAIGLAWECQIAAEIPADPWDEPLDYIATPDRILEMTS